MRCPDLRPRPAREADRKPASENVWFTLGGEQLRDLRSLAVRERTTLYVVMLALYYAVLYLVSGQRELAVGSVLANRPRRELFDTVGFFANMVILDARLPADPSFRDVLPVVRTTVLEALAHQEYPYLNAMLDPLMAPTAYRASEVVFHMLAVPDHVSPPSGINFAGLEVEPHPVPDGMGSRFDLELLVIPQVGMLEGALRYAPDRYDRAFVELLARYYRTLVDAVVTDPAVALSTVGAAQPES